MLNLISELGAIKTGLMLIIGLFLPYWQKYAHDKKLAQALLLERGKTPTDTYNNQRRYRGQFHMPGPSTATA